MPKVYARFSHLIAFFGNFLYYYLLLHVSNDITSSNLYRLYVKTEVYWWKVNLCKHLRLRQLSFYFCPTRANIWFIWPFYLDVAKIVLPKFEFLYREMYTFVSFFRIGRTANCHFISRVFYFPAPIIMNKLNSDPFCTEYVCSCT